MIYFLQSLPLHLKTSLRNLHLLPHLNNHLHPLILLQLPLTPPRPLHLNYQIRHHHLRCHYLYSISPYLNVGALRPPQLSF